MRLGQGFGAPVRRSGNSGGLNGLALVLALALVARLPRLTQALTAQDAALWLTAELAVTWLLYAIMERLSRGTAATAMPSKGLNLGRAFWTALAYALNPLPLLVGPSAHALSSCAAMGLAAAWFMDFSEHPASDLLSALCLSAASCLHPLGLLLMPIFLKNLEGRRERRAYFAAWAIPLALALGLRIWKAGAASLVPEFGGGLFGLGAALSSAFYGSQAPLDAARAAAESLGQVMTGLLAVLWLAYLIGPWRFPLLPGAALAALTWCVAAPNMDGTSLLAPLALGLLIPGGPGLSLSLVAGLAFLAYGGLFAPWEIQAPALWQAPQLPRAFHLAWASFQLGLFFFFLVEWGSILSLCRNPKGRLEYR